jgi:hypothetical protein
MIDTEDKAMATMAIALDEYCKRLHVEHDERAELLANVSEDLLELSNESIGMSLAERLITEEAEPTDAGIRSGAKIYLEGVEQGLQAAITQLEELVRQIQAERANLSPSSLE